jgi:hypothetical protein
MLDRSYPPMIAVSRGDGLALASSRASQMPAGAKITFVDVQIDPRIQLLDICRPQCLLLGAKCRFRGSIRAPVRAE